MNEERSDTWWVKNKRKSKLIIWNYACARCIESSEGYEEKERM